MLEQIAILGSTGSIGQNTLDVIAQYPNRFSVYALSAYQRIDQLREQVFKFHPKMVVLNHPDQYEAFISDWPRDVPQPEVRFGQEGLITTASDHSVTTVVAAIVGIAGMPSTLAAARSGKRILLANKEALVAAGHLMMDAVKHNDAQLLPIDSEHNAIFQCLPHGKLNDKVRRLVLTASGGPFLNYPLELLEEVTPEQACKHPNWSMGRKISVDSATMLNKGLEVIEAYYLFGVSRQQIEVLIHPQSIVHSMVDYMDGSMLAQLGHADMRIPISYALGYPDRLENNAPAFDLSLLRHLDFQLPNYERFPCLRLAFNALEMGAVACISLNAVNEVLVAAFLSGQIKFTQIANGIEDFFNDLGKQSYAEPKSLEEILAHDGYAREQAKAWVKKKQA